MHITTGTSEYGTQPSWKIEAKKNSFVIGTIYLRWANHLKTAVEIVGMFVQPAHRRKGIASTLFKQLLRDYPDLIRVSTASATPPARMFLLKHKFAHEEKLGWVLRLK